MTRHLHRDLESLEQDLLAQGSLVEQMIQCASKVLKKRSSDLIAKLLENEDAVNQQEVEIEEECLKILALHQPVAVDLRRVATVLKINGDLERIADLAVNIGERSHSLVAHGSFPLPENVDQMADVATSMVRDALDAFVQLDVESARDVCLRDDVVDNLNRQVIAELKRIVEADPSQIHPALHFFSASRHLERIADHATNIAEDVIYLVDGEIARHKHDEISMD